MNSAPSPVAADELSDAELGALVRTLARNLLTAPAPAASVSPLVEAPRQDICGVPGPDKTICVGHPHKVGRHKFRPAPVTARKIKRSS